MPIFANENIMDENNRGEANAPAEFDEDSEEEIEDNTIRRTDCLVVAGKIVGKGDSRKTSSATSRSMCTKKTRPTCTSTTT